MKLKGLTFFMSIIFSAGIMARSVYVTSIKTNVYAKPIANSTIVKTVKRGDKLTFVETKGAWTQVKLANKRGWVKKLFLSSKKPGKKLSILSKAKSNKNVHARKRASSDVTAASARGLSRQSDRDFSRYRGNRSMLGIAEGYAALEKMESILIDEQTLLLFLRAEKLQP